MSFDKESDKWSVYAALEPEDVSMLLQEASQFLLQYLNRGNFEGSGGADQLLVRRLTLVYNMLFIAWNAFDKDKKPAISGLYSRVEQDEALRA